MTKDQCARAEQVWLSGRLRALLKSTADERGHTKSSLGRRYIVEGLRRDGKLKEGE